MQNPRFCRVVLWSEQIRVLQPVWVSTFENDVPQLITMWRRNWKRAGSQGSQCWERGFMVMGPVPRHSSPACTSSTSSLSWCTSPKVRAHVSARNYRNHSLNNSNLQQMESLNKVTQDLGLKPPP